MKARLKAKSIKAFFSKRSGQKKPEGPNSEPAGHGEQGATTSTPPSIVVMYDSPEATQPDRNTSEIGSTSSTRHASNDDSISATTTSHSDTRDILGSEVSSAQVTHHHEGDIATSALPDTLTVNQWSQSQPQQPHASTAGAADDTTSASNNDAISVTAPTLCSDNTESEWKALEVSDKISTGGFLAGAHHMSLSNLLMVDHSTTIMPKAGDKVGKAKKLLSKRMIPGAAHDSSARDPPPKCHPGTRIKINERVIAWFYDETKKELVLWIYGPAGVGKSAIVQTLAEALASAQCLGASVFFSRPNKRNNSQSVFITIAYQLAVHIEPYGTFVSEKLTFDPELVNKSMEEQFRAFIVEPFALKKIGEGEKTWGILFDGLDELDHYGPQKKIISLITNFARDYPEVPLVWVISSRPEPHITNTFKQQTTSSYWEEHVPIDSPESCQDVERFLRSSFETMHKDFQHIVPQGWPEETKIVKLAHAASGLFTFADVAIRFIADIDYADLITRLDLVISVIDRPRDYPVDDQPFANLDALYTCILSRIPPKMWVIARRVLGADMVLSDRGENCLKRQSVVLGIGLNRIYPSVNYLYSVLKIPPLEEVYTTRLKFLHASFGDFLQDATRSKEFYISREDANRDLLDGSLKLWLDFKRESSGGSCSEYMNEWSRYVSQFDDTSGHIVGFDMPRSFHNKLFHHVHESLRNLLLERWNTFKEDASQHHWDHFLNLLCRVDTATACHGFMKRRGIFIDFLFDVWKERREELTIKGFAREIPLEQLQLDHLEWPKEPPSDTIFNELTDDGRGSGWELNRIDSPRIFDDYIADLRYLRRSYPQAQVLIWAFPRSHFAVFSRTFNDADYRACPRLFQEINFGKEDTEKHGHYCIPYPDHE